MTTVGNKKYSSDELELKNICEGKCVIFTIFIGVFDKPKGGTFNLRECHSLLCQTVHNDVTYSYDPRTDMIFTICTNIE